MNFLIIGLGNPGEKYEKTRHNIGFDLIDKIAKDFDFSEFKNQNMQKSKISKGAIVGKKTVLAKPQTFMNDSGKSARQLINSFKPKNQNWLIIHDDIDLPLGRIRLVKNRGAAGHRGVESIIKELKTKNFTRLRVGVCPKTGKPKSPEKFVLQKFKKDEEKILEQSIKKALKALEVFVESGLEKAMSEFNK